MGRAIVIARSLWPLAPVAGTVSRADPPLAVACALGHGEVRPFRWREFQTKPEAAHRKTTAVQPMSSYPRGPEPQKGLNQKSWTTEPP